MKLSTKIKLLFSKKLRKRLSCCGCELPCKGCLSFQSEELCQILIDSFEKGEMK